MSLDVMQQITQAEAQGKLRKTEEATRAKQLIAQGEAQSQGKLAQAKVEAQAQVAQLLLEAEERAAVRSKAAMAETEAANQALHQVAQAHMDQAATLIVRRVVNG